MVFAASAGCLGGVYLSDRNKGSRVSGFRAFVFIRVGGFTHRPQSSSFLGLPYRILNMSHKKELLWGLRVRPREM